MSRKLKDIEKELQDLKDEYTSITKELEDKGKEIEKVSDEFCEASDDYVKIQCLNCGGLGYIQDDDKKVVCSNENLPFLSCGGKKFIWMKRYKE